MFGSTFYCQPKLMDDEHGVAYFLLVECSTGVRGLPHSMHDAFNRDVINPQNGHMVCVPYPAICGLSLRIR